MSDETRPSDFYPTFEKLREITKEAQELLSFGCGANAILITANEVRLLDTMMLMLKDTKD